MVHALVNTDSDILYITSNCHSFSPAVNDV